MVIDIGLNLTKVLVTAINCTTWVLSLYIALSCIHIKWEKGKDE